MVLQVATTPESPTCDHSRVTATTCNHSRVFAVARSGAVVGLQPLRGLRVVAVTPGLWCGCGFGFGVSTVAQDSQSTRRRYSSESHGETKESKTLKSKFALPMYVKSHRAFEACGNFTSLVVKSWCVTLQSRSNQTSLLRHPSGSHASLSPDLRYSGIYPATQAL